MKGEEEQDEATVRTFDKHTLTKVKGHCSLSRSYLMIAQSGLFIASPQKN